MKNVIENVPLWSVTTWDKSFNGVEKEWQPKTIKYKYLLSDELDQINVGGDVYLLYTGKDIGYTTEELAGDAIVEGEIVSIPWGGTPSVKYYKGKFVTGDNRIATSNKPEELLNKYLYYYLKGHIREISSYYRGAGLKHPAMRDVLKMNISYPTPIDQKIIILQFERLEIIIELRRKELDRLDELIKARFVEMFGGCETYESLENADVYISDGNYSSKYPTADEFVKEGVPFIRASNMVDNTITDHEMYYISVEKHAELLKGHVKPFDVLIATRGAGIGKIAVVPEKHDDSNINAQIVLLRCNTNVYNPLYLSWYMKLNETQIKIKGLISGSAQPQLPIKRLVQLELLKPDIDKQNEFSDFVKQVDKSKVVA